MYFKKTFNGKTQLMLGRSDWDISLKDLTDAFFKSGLEGVYTVVEICIADAFYERARKAKEAESDS